MNGISKFRYNRILYELMVYTKISVQYWYVFLLIPKISIRYIVFCTSPSLDL